MTLHKLIRLEMLSQRKHVFALIVSGERGGNLRLCRATAVVSVPREHARIGLPRDDVAHDAQARLAGDVADDQGQLHVHLQERLLHALNAAGGVLDQGLAMTEVRT